MKKGFIAVFLLVGACKSTESINRFARSAGAGITEINRSNFGFETFCRKYTQAPLGRLTDTSPYGKGRIPVTYCTEYKTSDSLLRVINETLGNYFALLQSVSDKKLLAYNARPLVSSLADIQPRLLPALSFSDEKVTAVKGLLNTLLNEPLKYYRARKLKKIMRENDSALAMVTGAYAFILDSALLGEARQAAENYKSFVYARLYGWAVSPVEKAYVNDRYHDFLAQMDGEQQKISKSVSLLKTIRKDHRLLAFEEGKPEFRATETEITQDILLINKRIEEITRLNK
jgi:hypothetical protein